MKKAFRNPCLAGTLDKQLERESKYFFNEPRNVSVDVATRTAFISEILNFYPEDFLMKAPSLIAYLNRYRESKVPENYQVKFLDYDWTVNRQPSR
ncbi:MAG: hypothetical protein ACI8W7_002395 [Gammaproteobacteria bacterium]